MMDYSNNEKEKNTFIKGYKIKKNKIIVKLAGRRKNIIQNTNKNIEKLNQKMELQVKNAKMKKYNIFDKIALKVNSSFLACVCSLIIFYIITILVRMIFPVFLTGSIILGFTFLGEYFVSKSFIKIKKNEDLEKHKIFIENKDIINETVQKDETLFWRINKSDSKKIEKMKNSSQTLDINSIDKLSLETLKTIRENITSKNVINDNKDSQIEYDAVKSKKLVR